MENFKSTETQPNEISVCKCLLDDKSSEGIVILGRKQNILTTVSRTEYYLRERRIPELIRFLFTKVIAEGSDKPMVYLEKLLDDCMLFRAGYALAPVLYESRHLKAVIKSFDPGQRGWLSAGQIRRAYTTLGLTPKEFLDDRVQCDIVINSLKDSQETELLGLLSAGMEMDDKVEDLKSESST
ncbi:uncharacterized protein LOC115455726 [Manduca sexta]|uniref:uncharacterized protein LOC115455726 n=1 Tax=Manduca sexta TaxID=7130 RepID=UPI00188DE794|nr:uncharacterized protein LOC115455726 [Manduca sexta]